MKNISKSRRLASVGLAAMVLGSGFAANQSAGAAEAAVAQDSALPKIFLKTEAGQQELVSSDYCWIPQGCYSGGGPSGELPVLEGKAAHISIPGVDFREVTLQMVPISPDADRSGLRRVDSAAGGVYTFRPINHVGTYEATVLAVKNAREEIYASFTWTFPAKG
ncbi:hypothetical protein [Demetria terragena]|uniref:hypothetical protein n=1 Tax=Demetria terragena TaxID=63959 RepID=UPI00035F2351|nr:hypothetical protein [Demetria terragena]